MRLRWMLLTVFVAMGVPAGAQAPYTPETVPAFEESIDVQAVNLEAVVTDVHHVPAERLQQRLRPREGHRRAAHHDRQCSRLGALRPAAHRRVEYVEPAGETRREPGPDRGAPI